MLPSKWNYLCLLMSKISENIRCNLKKPGNSEKWNQKANCARQLYIGIYHAQAGARKKFRHATSVCLPIPKSSRTPPNTTGKFNKDLGGSHGIWSPETIHPNAGQDPRPTRRGSDKIKGRNPHPWEGPIESKLNLTFDWTSKSDCSV